MEFHTPSPIDVFIDESQLDIGGRSCLLYAAVIPRDFEEAVRSLAEVKLRFGMPAHAEVKWTLAHVDPTTKAALKEQVLGCLAQTFECLVSITEGADKDAAFINSLRQISAFMRAAGYKFANIYCDAGCVRSRASIAREFAGWSGIACTGFGEMDSRYSVGIQFADILAGTFRYVVAAAFGGPSRTVRYYDAGYQEDVQLALDQHFRLMLRTSFWGDMPEYSEAVEIESYVDSMSADCFGKGIVVHGCFTDAELDTLRDISRFYRGCMH